MNDKMKDQLKVLVKHVSLSLGLLPQKDREQLDNDVEKQEALLRLRAILPSADAYEKAIAWQKYSLWNLEELCQFIAATGGIPPDEAKKFPTETLFALRFRPIPKLDLVTKNKNIFKITLDK